MKMHVFAFCAAHPLTVQHGNWLTGIQMPSSSDTGKKLIPIGAAMMNLQRLRLWTNWSKQVARLLRSKPHTWIGSSSILPV